MTEPTLPPRCAERFLPERLLARGGFGAVWLARQVGLERPVAIKVLHPNVLEDETARKRFENEARIGATLADPHIVKLVDHGVEDDVPWIAFELVPGESLFGWVGAGSGGAGLMVRLLRLLFFVLEPRRASRHPPMGSR